MTIIAEVAKRLDAHYVHVISDSNGYQGCDYFILSKGNNYTVVNLHFGTCALCDWRMGLREDWLIDHPDCRYSEVPLEAFEPIIATMVDDANERGFHPVETLIKDHFHMIFGSGYCDENMAEQAADYLRSR